MLLCVSINAENIIKFKKKGKVIYATVDVMNYPVIDLLKAIAGQKKIDLIFSTDVSGYFTGRFIDVNINTLFSKILKSNSLDYEVMGNIYRIDTQSNIQKYRKQLEDIEKANSEIEPLETRVIRINYADLSALKSNIAKILSARGSIASDERTKKLIITDVPSKFNVIYKFVQSIDIPTKQVLIKVKFIQLSHSDMEHIEFYWKAGVTGDPAVTGGSYTGTNSYSPATGAGLLHVGIVKNTIELDAVINMLASKNKAEVRSHPQILAMNNEPATINIGNKIPLRMVNESGEITTQLTYVGTQIKVTPQITADNSIILNIHPEVSSIAGQVSSGVLIDTNEVDTQVMLKNKETAVIGGLVKMEDSEGKSGIPILMDIPIIGSLFRTKDRDKSKIEILILVTPVIQEAINE